MSRAGGTSEATVPPLACRRVLLSRCLNSGSAPALWLHYFLVFWGSQGLSLHPREEGLCQGTQKEVKIPVPVVPKRLAHHTQGTQRAAESLGGSSCWF